jgi:WD40 repeat protein
VRIWDTHTGRQVADLPLGWVRAIAWSHDGKWLATAAGHTVRVWDSVAWQQKQDLPGPDTLALSWNSESRRLASVDQTGAVRVWDTATGRQLWKEHPLIFPSHPRRRPDGSVAIYVGPQDPMDVAFGLHRPSIDCIAWNPARDLLACGGFQGVQICSASDGRQELVLRVHLSYVTAVAWSPDGRRLASCGDDGVVTVWDLAFPRK